MTKMTGEQRRVVLLADSKATPCRGGITGHPGTVKVLLREGWAAGSGPLGWHVTRDGLIAAGLDMDALHAEAMAENIERVTD